MMQGKFISEAVVLAFALGAVACSKSAPPPADASTEESAEPAAEEPLAEPEVTNDADYVEGVAGGVMTSTLTFEAAVVSVDQQKREAVLRGPEGKEVTVRVGKEAVNFYQVAAGDRVRVQAVRQLVVAVNEGEAAGPDGTAVAAGSAEKGDTPGAAVVATTRISSKITAMDEKARTATLTFQDGAKETFDVRPDVDMTRYKVGQEVVFLMTEALALEVQKL